MAKYEGLRDVSWCFRFVVRLFWLYLATSKLDSRHLGFFSMLWGARKCFQKRQNGELCITQKVLVVLFLLWCRSHANLRSGVILFFILFYFFASLLLWLEREKNNAWHIHLTSRQPPPNLHNLTFAWPAMLLANKRLPYGNQILARIMSLLKSILGKRKFLSTSMFRWRFLKKNLMCCFCEMKYC